MTTLAFLFGNGTIDQWLASYGYVVVFGLVALESLGIPLPGETSLIAGALYAGSTHRLAIWWVIAAAAAGAIVGDNAGFAIGRWGGYRLLRRYGHVVRLDERKLKVGVWIFRHHGGKVVFFGRFVSILRTWAAFLAGTNRMDWKRFLAFNAGGGVVWAVAFGIAYYEFGAALKRLSTPLDLGLGAAASLVLIGFAVWVHRKEGELEERAGDELEGSVAEELDEDERVAGGGASGRGSKATTSGARRS